MIYPLLVISTPAFSCFCIIVVSMSSRLGRCTRELSTDIVVWGGHFHRHSAVSEIRGENNMAACSPCFSSADVARHNKYPPWSVCNLCLHYFFSRSSPSVYYVSSVQVHGLPPVSERISHSECHSGKLWECWQECCDVYTLSSVPVHVGHTCVPHHH